MAWVFGFIFGAIVGVGLTAAAAWLLSRRLLRDAAKARQNERLAELGTLTGGLAHEIKNPLSTVQLNLQLLNEDLDPTAPPSQGSLNRLATVAREAARMRETLDDFLRYAGRIELDRKPTDLHALESELVDFVAPQAQASRVNLRLKPVTAPVMANIDARFLKQALLNLILNAIQVMPDGGEVMLGCGYEPGGVCLDVTDTGPGITPEEQQKVFDAYFSKRRGGTGLGLAMTRRIAEEHGGSVELRSAVGKGSSFILHLPRKSP